MQKHINLVSKAREHLAANMPWEAAAVLEELATQMSELPLASKKLMLSELAALQLLVDQGLDLSGKWRERVAPTGSAYDAAGTFLKYGAEPGGQLPPGLTA